VKREFEAGAPAFTLLGLIVPYAVNGLMMSFQPLFAVPAKLGAGAAVYGFVRRAR